MDREKEEVNFLIDLELFGKAEDEGRTEEASSYRLRKAREEGKVAKSQDLVSGFVLLGVLVGLWFLGGGIFRGLKGIFEKSFIWDRVRFLEGNLGLYLEEAVWDMWGLLWPLFIVVVVFGVLGNVIQVGFMFTGKKLKVDFKKVSFQKNKIFGKIFFSRGTVVNFMKSIFKVLVVIFLTYGFLRWNEVGFYRLIDMGLVEGLSFIMEVGFYIGLGVGGIFLLMGIPDYFFQKMEYREDLKMTRYEMKEERKDTEGDMNMRQRLRDRQMEILKVRLVEEVSKADVVITNPTHYAVALKYEQERMRAPVVVSKGMNYMALKIKEIAMEKGVYQFEDKVLAQSLYYGVEVGDEIPEDLYQAVAEVLAYVLRAREKVRV